MRRDGNQVIGLVGDFGGSNARFAVAAGDGEGGIALSAEQDLVTAAYPDVVAAARHFLGQQRIGPVQAACFAIAGPVTGDRVELTNARWRFSIAESRAALGLDHLDVVNDFSALALSLPYLKGADLERIGGGEPAANETKAVIGPGTGLGVSGLIWSGRAWIPLKSEGGHATYSPVGEREREVGRILERRYGHVSCERVLSGGGLVNLYEALREITGEAAADLTPPQITAKALTADGGLCAEAVEIFCAALGTAAGSLALTLGARGGVYVGGGIVPRLLPLLRRSAFRMRFDDKGRLTDYVRGIPAYLILRQHAGLLGAAAALVQEKNNGKGE
ncbi:MAG: glucokinase [Dongiaceae bacterium]